MDWRFSDWLICDVLNDDGGGGESHWALSKDPQIVPE